jgi:hypothetical protein
MAEFVLLYNRPENYTPGNDDTKAAWAAWFAGIGNDLIEMGKPVISAVHVGDCGDGQRLGGYSVITADSLAEAQLIAQSCPGLGSGGGVEIGALVDLT